MPFISDAASVATIIGALAIPITIYQYTQEQKKKREADEQAELDKNAQKEVVIFNTLSVEWRDFLKLCVRYPAIDLTDGKPIVSPTTQQARARIEILYEMMISICESAFQYYQFDPNEQKDKYWKGWDKFLKDWLKTPDFKLHCQANINGGYYSEDFTGYLRSLI